MNWFLLTVKLLLVLSWQAALTMTVITLDLLADIDKHLFIEAGIRGGVVVISHRHGQANLP